MYSSRDYGFFSLKDKKAGDVLSSSGIYTSAVVNYHQAIEKAMKQIIIDKRVLVDVEDLKTHSIGKLYRLLESNSEEIRKLNFHRLKTITDYYFDCRYPSYDFYEIPEEECNEVKIIAEKVIIIMNSVHKSESNLTSEF